MCETGGISMAEKKALILQIMSVLIINVVIDERFL